jgi:ankyrin repeat protein
MFNSPQMNELGKAAICCQRNNVATLQAIVPSLVSPNELVPQIKLNLLSRKNVPLLCVAAASGSLDCVVYLVKVGANINDSDSSGSTPVHWAAMWGHDKILRFLLENGAKISSHQFNPLLLAARNGRYECVSVLLDSGADINCVDQTGRTPLHLAAWFGHNEIAKLLLSKGASFEQIDNFGRAPLHLAAWFGNIMTLKTILEKSKTVINLQNKAGNTPLHLACLNNHKEVVSTLLNAGANSKIKNAIGQTALSIAEADDKPEIFEILQQKEGEDTKKGVLVDMTTIHEIKSINRTLDELINSQDKHAQDVRSLRENLDIQATMLQRINSKQNEMKKQVYEIKMISSEIAKKVEGLVPKKSRYVMSRIPK